MANWIAETFGMEIEGAQMLIDMVSFPLMVGFLFILIVVMAGIGMHRKGNIKLGKTKIRERDKEIV